MEWKRLNRYAWRSDRGYTITACRVPEREDTPANAHRAKPASSSYLDTLVPLYWHYVLYAPVPHPDTAGATEGLIGSSYDPGELREQAMAHDRARALGRQ